MENSMEHEKETANNKLNRVGVLKQNPHQVSLCSKLHGEAIRPHLHACK